MVNETIDRIMLRKLLPVSEEAAKIAVGIYSANYKLAIFITLFIQAFRMSAEPFFFSQSTDKNAPIDLCPCYEVVCDHTVPGILVHLIVY